MGHLHLCLNRGGGLALPPPWHPAPTVPAPVAGARPDLGEAIAEAGEHLLHVASLLHGDDPQVVLLVDPHQEGLIVIVPGGGAQSSLLPGLWSQGTSRKQTLGGPQAGGTSQVPGVLIPAVPRSGGRCPDSSPVNSLGARREARTAQRRDRKRGLSCFPSLPIRYCVVPTKGIRGRGSQHSPLQGDAL